MVALLEMHASRFLTASSQAPKVFTLRSVPGEPETQLSETARPPRGYGVTRNAQPHITGVRPRELLCSESGAFSSWDPMVVET
jgi:hypothetical protein